jgi:adenosylcobinamide kinase/adenosylcobinamide-phosphate guanylyltransferase
MPLTFVTGPVRSGKSRFAERLAVESGGDVTYVATARTDPTDAEWVARIAHHVARRPASWRTIETGPLGAPSLAEIAGDARAGAVLLVDSLGTWLAAEMSARFEADGESAALDSDALDAACTSVADALAASAAHAIVVGDEAGWGLVPPYPSGRVFRDVLGRMQQRLATRAERAYLVVAGYAIDLRVAGRPV